MEQLKLQQLYAKEYYVAVKNETELYVLTGEDMFHIGVENRMQSNVCNMVKIHKIKLHKHTQVHTE